MDLKEVRARVSGARKAVRVLMSHKDPNIRKTIKLERPWKDELEIAARSVIGDSFYLSMAIDVLEHPGIPFLGRFLTREFMRRSAKADNALHFEASAREAAREAP